MVAVNATTYRYSENFNASQIPRDAYRVHVTDYPINTVTANLFAHLNGCRLLYLERTKISEIESGAWFGLDQLTLLYINHNELTILTAGMFNHLPSLSNLFLGNSKISSIDFKAFANLTSLKYLSLPFNSLQVLQINVFKDLSKVRSLSMAGNKIFRIEYGAFNGLDSLITLNLNFNNLSSSIFTPNVFDNVADTLTHFLIGNNRITVIYNDVFRNFTALETLVIDVNDTVEPHGFRGLDFTVHSSVK